MKFDFVDPKIKEPATVNPDWTCGADLGDLDNDGDMDMVIGDHIRIEDSLNHRLYVLLNDGNQANGDPKFRDITFEAGVVKLAGRAPHVQIQDIDNDGWVDIMVSNAHNLVFQNKGIRLRLLLKRLGDYAIKLTSHVPTHKKCHHNYWHDRKQQKPHGKSKCQ